MKEVRKYLQGFGFNDESITIILETYPICNMSEDTLLDHCKENNKWFLENDYTKEEIIKMGKLLPALYSYSIDNIKQKIDDLIELGYTKEEIIKMTKLLPSLYGCSIDNIKQKIDDFIELGYTKEDVIKMTNLLPALYGYSIDNIKQKIDDFIELGYTKEEIIKMTKLLPQLYSLSIDNIKQKIEYLREIHLDFIVTGDTKKLMQSVDLTYARYEFLTNQGKIIDIENYRILYYDNKQFAKQFGVTKQQLLTMYPYKERKERRNVM